MVTKKKGFTLVELLVAMAIIGILASAVMYSYVDSVKNARSSRAMAQASSAVTALVSCWGNAGAVNNPNVHGGNDICNGKPGFGTWPDMTQINYSYSSVTGTMANSFYFSVTGDSTITICCNSAMNSCGRAASCNGNTTW
jgi:prepilin-type N-terminal cleavage/methylation domain-containing protein